MKSAISTVLGNVTILAVQETKFLSGITRGIERAIVRIERPAPGVDPACREFGPGAESAHVFYPRPTGVWSNRPNLSHVHTLRVCLLARVGYLTSYGLCPPMSSAYKCDL
jgi:hypothetical protein